MTKTKKQFKAEYKQMKFPMGVFQIRIILNSKVLIDNSVNMNSKWNRHIAELNLGTHRNTELQKDWNKFGEECFIFEVLSELKQKEDNEDVVNYSKELKFLQQMILDEMVFPEKLKY